MINSNDWHFDQRSDEEKYRDEVEYYKSQNDKLIPEDKYKETLMWIKLQFENDGMENMGVREQVIYKEIENILRDE